MKRRFALIAFASLGLLQADSQPEWKALFNGTSLEGWRDADFPRHPPARVEKDAIILPHGQPLTGITWSGAALPKTNYEIRFEAVRMQGGDFFASLTFPVQDSFATLVTGGWGGDIVGISSIDGWDASDNETRKYFTFEPNRYYAFRLQVTPDRIQAWIDEKQIVDVVITGRTIGLRPGDIKYSTPLGFASYNTTGGLRKIEYRTLKAKP